MDSYTFEMVARGNHTFWNSFVEEPLLRFGKSICHRLGVVYKNLNDEETLSIGKQHKLAGETHLSTKFQYNVQMKNIDNARSKG